LQEDTEVLFILTTNRPDQLEPALASRPGRIDQAIEFPLPGDEGREKLTTLYARACMRAVSTCRPQ
jgi:cell division protease FtsH